MTLRAWRGRLSAGSNLLSVVQRLPGWRRMRPAMLGLRAKVAWALGRLVQLLPARFVTQNLQLKRHFEGRLFWLPTPVVNAVILSEQHVLEQGAVHGGWRGLRGYRGLWKNGATHPSRWWRGSFLLQPDPGCIAVPLEEKHSFETIRSLASGEDWRGSVEYQRIIGQVEAGDFRYTKGCRTAVEVERYFRNLADLITVIQEDGFRTQQELGKPPGDEIQILVSGDGSGVLFAGGSHRLAIAGLLGISPVPVVVKGVSRAWARLCVQDHGLPLTTALQRGISELGGCK
jgi:hypothetical protein